MRFQGIIPPIPWTTIDVPTLLRLIELNHVAGVKQNGGNIHKLSDLPHICQGKDVDSYGDDPPRAAGPAGR